MTGCSNKAMEGLSYGGGDAAGRGGPALRLGETNEGKEGPNYGREILGWIGASFHIECMSPSAPCSPGFSQREIVVCLLTKPHRAV